MPAASQPIYSVSVRELVKFALQTGDLGGERDFVGSNRALKGIRGHQRIQRSRPAGYQKELVVSHEISSTASVLRIHGRIDGILENYEGVLIEEIKTVGQFWSRTADPLHWAQAKFYGFMYAHEKKLEEVTVQLTYLNLETDEPTEFCQKFSFAKLTAFFNETTAIYQEWIDERQRWCRRRDDSIQNLAFPFAQYRPGQRKLAVAAYQTLCGGGRLFAEAPTGTGKTISAIFPSLKSLAAGKLDQTFYLTARTVGRMVAEKVFGDLKEAGASIRVLTVTARSKLCVREGHPCDINTCPLAIGYYDRCKPAIRDALNCEVITRPVLEAVSGRHQVCPFELSLDASLWVDVVICDYNYVFDPQVYLRRHFAEPDRRYGFLVDEAHNLVDRAREMFSSELSSHDIDEVQRMIRKTIPKCAKTLVRLSSELRQFPHPSQASGISSNVGEERDLFISDSTSQDQQNAEENPFTKQRGGSLTSRKLPANLPPLIEDALQVMEGWLVLNQAADFREALLQLYFQFNSFLRTCELYDENYVTIIEQEEAINVRLFCLDPSSRLREICDRAQAVLFFSGTLTPIDYYRNLLGGMSDDRLLQLASPFPPENLAVLINHRIRTDLKCRGETLDDVVDAIGTLVHGRRGNYLVYFPSYQYLKTTKELFQTKHPGIRILEQRPEMTESEREAFLAAFASDHAKTLVGFAVLGGMFGEGIDLVGERLIAAVVVGVGLPQLNVERDLMRDHFQSRNGKGFDYAYTFPGMNRVVQAVGRVIRSETDRGIVLLIDRRFADARYRHLFPKHWQIRKVANPAQIKEAIQEFWSNLPAINKTDQFIG
ncbi:MAG: ATP-dependent DNA helicase [Limisphaerales bacterium]